MDGLAALLDIQDGLLSRTQAIQHGLSRHALAHKVSSGRWQRVHPEVFAVETGPLSYRQRIWAGVLYVGPGALASHRSAWWLQDRGLHEPEQVQLLIPSHRDVRNRPGLLIRRTRRLHPDDIHPVPWPPRLRVERAVLDCAADAKSAEAAIALLTSAVQRRTTTPQLLQAALRRLPNQPHRALLLDVIELAGAGAHSLLEVAHDRACSSHGLPQPDRQRRIGPAFVDAAYDCPNGTVVIELDGRMGHLDVAGWWRDMQRDNRHTVHGLATLRFPGFVLLTNPHEVAATIAAALTARGWAGALRCPRSCATRSRS